MELSVGTLWALLRLTLVNPAQAAEVILRTALPPAGRMAAMGIVTALSAILLWATYSLVPMELPDGTQVPAPGPLFWAAMVGAGMLLTSAVILGLGRLAGGRGTMAGILPLVSWFQFFQLALSVAQFVLLLAMPPLGLMVTLGSVVMLVWILGHFVRVAHGFQSVAGPILGIVGVALVMGIILVFGA